MDAIAPYFKAERRFGEAVMDAVPPRLKRAIAVGIGLFILFISAVDSGLIASSGIPAPPVAFAGSNPDFPLTINRLVLFIGLFVTIALYVMKVRAALRSASSSGRSSAV